MQDDSYLRWPLKNMSAKGKCTYPNLRWPPKNKTSANKYFTTNFIHLVHKACHILSTSTNQCHCLHLHSQCLHSSHSLQTFPSSSLPFHNISSSVPSNALDIQHFLKPFTVTYGKMHCHAIMSHNDTTVHLHFLVYKCTWTHNESKFSA